MWVGLLRKPTSADQSPVFAFNLAPSFSPAFSALSAFSARCLATPLLPSSCFTCFDFQCHFCCIDACSVLLVEGQSHTALTQVALTEMTLFWPSQKDHASIYQTGQLWGVGCKWVVWAPHRGTRLSAPEEVASLLHQCCVLNTDPKWPKHLNQLFVGIHFRNLIKEGIKEGLKLWGSGISDSFFIGLYFWCQGLIIAVL